MSSNQTRKVTQYIYLNISLEFYVTITSTIPFLLYFIDKYANVHFISFFFFCKILHLVHLPFFELARI